MTPALEEIQTTADLSSYDVEDGFILGSIADRAAKALKLTE